MILNEGIGSYMPTRLGIPDKPKFKLSLFTAQSMQKSVGYKKPLNVFLGSDEHGGEKGSQGE